MSNEKKKIYKSGDQINLRLSKSRVTQDVIKAINEANDEHKLNEFALTAFEFYVKHKKNNKDIAVDIELKNKSIVENDKLIGNIQIYKEEEVKLIKENKNNNAEDELFGESKGGKMTKKGLNGAFSSLRRKR